MDEEAAKANSLAQRQRRLNGQNYQVSIHNEVATALADIKSVKVTSPGTKANPTNRNIQINTQLGPFIPDVDVLICDAETNTPLIVISTKTSLRERLTGTFYSTRALRDKFPGLVAIVCMKGDREFDKNGKPKSLELGTDSKPSRARVEALYENVRIFVDNSEIAMGVNVRPRAELIGYIKEVLAE